MTFNFKLGLKQSFRAIFRSSKINLALKPRRVIVLTLYIILFPIIEVITWFSFWLDKIFYPQFEDYKITNPVFVIGNYRSGTTLLHTYLSYDYRRFTSMTGWEIFIAPSIVQRKLLHLFVAFDRFFGSPVVRTFDHLWEKFAQGPVYFHKLGVRDPEEDENLLAHIWSGIIPLNLFPEFEDGKIPGYAYYDKLLNQRQKDRIMKFYRGCIQRHLYFHGGKKAYLSKSPSFSGHIETLIEAFPNAKFIYIVRSPYEVVPSSINLWSFKWHVTLEPDEEYPYKDQVLDMIKDYYLHPYEVLKKLPEDRYHFVYYDELMENPETSVQAIYDAFGFQMYPLFRRRFHRVIRRHQNYKRPKEYSLKNMGLSNLKIFENFKGVFKKYNLNPFAGAKLKFSKIPRKWTLIRRKQKQKAAEEPIDPQ